MDCTCCSGDASKKDEADLTSCQQLQDRYHNGNLVYDDDIVLLVLPTGTMVCVWATHSNNAQESGCFTGEGSTCKHTKKAKGLPVCNGCMHKRHASGCESS